MRKKWVIAIGSAMLLATIIAVAVWSGEREPEYQGKKLSEWLELQDPVEAYNGLTAIGTNALPVLLRWVDLNPPKWKISLSGWLSKYPRTGMRRKLDWWLLGKDFHRFLCAARAFGRPGPKGCGCGSAAERNRCRYQCAIEFCGFMLAWKIEAAARRARPG